MLTDKNQMRRGTLSFRLSIWYMAIFVLTSIMILSIFYYRISTVTMRETDDQLIEELNDFIAITDVGGRDQIMAEFDSEAAEEAGKNLCIRLLSSDGRILKSAGMPGSTLPVSKQALDALITHGGHIFETVEIAGHKYRIRTIYGAISSTIFFNMGMSLEDNYAYLHIFRNLILLLMIPLFVFAAFVGWFLARHALQGVAEVTQTALKISNGSIDRRVAVKRRSYEIDCLANTFNGMLDRIQSLITGMQQMNDNIAHDLRSPLTRIRGIAEMTLMGEKSMDDYREMAITTIEECDNLIEIINTMLDITEAEAGVSQDHREKVDLIKLIKAACELFDPIAEEKGVRLITVLPERLFVLSDRGKLQRLVTNLLENAIKFNRPGGTVTISANIENHRINIRVEDTGLGISAAELPRIFERFYRCDGSRSQAGIGLGLSLANAIVRTLGGEIHVQSIVNQGSKFTVSLPG